MRAIRGVAACFCFAALSLAGTASAAARDTGPPDEPPTVAKPVYRWEETGVRTFYGTDAALKTQGIASDGTHMFFSSNSGVYATQMDMEMDLANNFFAIPRDMTDRGFNHIGDIDYYDGKVYAPVEDGPGYAHPTLITFDAGNLEAGPERFAVDSERLKNGFPWIAIDPGRQVAYSGAWNNTGILNIHRLSDFAITSTVTLDKAVPRIQGAAVYKDFLYAARDDGAEKEIIAIDPVTGHVSHLFDRNFGIHDEVEGMTFVQNSGGTTLRTLDIVNPTRVDVHDYRINGDVDPPVLSIAKVMKPEIHPGGAMRVGLISSEKVTTDAEWSRCIGGRKNPCGRTRDVGPADLDTVRGGSLQTRIPSRKRYAPPGRFLGPGTYELTITPTDAADAVGKPTSAPVRILAPGSQPRGKPHRHPHR